MMGDWCDVCNAPQYVTPDGEHHCGEEPMETDEFGDEPPEDEVNEWGDPMDAPLPDPPPEQEDGPDPTLLWGPEEEWEA